MGQHEPSVFIMGTVSKSWDQKMVLWSVFPETGDFSSPEWVLKEVFERGPLSIKTQGVVLS